MRISALKTYLNSTALSAYMRDYALLLKVSELADGMHHDRLVILEDGAVALGSLSVCDGAAVLFQKGARPHVLVSEGLSCPAETVRKELAEDLLGRAVSAQAASLGLANLVVPSFQAELREADLSGLDLNKVDLLV